MARLLQVYECVLLPFGNGRRYDMVVDTGKRFLRVQCKTGNMQSGAIVFHASSQHWHRGGKLNGYRGQADFFGVYCSAVDKVYLVPVEDVSETYGYLRIDPPRNNQKQGIRWARDYELSPENAPE